MNVTRNGKVARLPREVREQLNRRLQDGQQGKRLVVWLNGLPEVQAVMTAEFGGKPLREQNISEWRKGGFRDWLVQHEAVGLVRGVTADADELQADDRPPLTDTLALWLAARYAVATRTLAGKSNGGEVDWHLLRELCNDVVALRRGDLHAERLRLERERLEFDREHALKQADKDHWAWAKDPEIRERICQGYVSRAEKIECLGKAMFGEHWREQFASADPSSADAVVAGNGAAPAPRIASVSRDSETPPESKGHLAKAPSIPSQTMKCCLSVRRPPPRGLRKGKYGFATNPHVTRGSWPSSEAREQAG